MFCEILDSGKVFTDSLSVCVCAVRPPLMKTHTLPAHRSHPTVDTPLAKVSEHTCVVLYLYPGKWNSSNPGTSGTEESVHISVVSLFQGLNCMQEQFLGKDKVSWLCISREEILRERFHYTLSVV